MYLEGGGRGLYKYTVLAFSLRKWGKSGKKISYYSRKSDQDSKRILL